MKTYTIEIVETLARVIEVQAKSEREALEKVTADYRDGTEVLDEGDFTGYEINII
jgi:hypothetical protein